MPPLVGVEVNVKLSPEQMEVDEAVMSTLGVSSGFTVIVSESEVAINGLTQPAFELMVQ